MTGTGSVPEDSPVSDGSVPDGSSPDNLAPDGPAPDTPAPALVVATFPMRPGDQFAWHAHADHQVAWAARGVLTVVTEQATWVLPPTRALWIPAGVRHETSAGSGAATFRSVYLRPSTCPIAWPQPTPIAARPLLAELIGYLGDDSLDPPRRARAEAVLVDLLQPVARNTVELRLPASPLLRPIALALIARPADPRPLDAWARQPGVSGRTLARAFLAETAVPFGRWRTLARLQAALSALAAGEPVGNVARRVGYESASAFVAAFRRETGLTPAAYFRNESEG